MEPPSASGHSNLDMVRVYCTVKTQSILLAGAFAGAIAPCPCFTQLLRGFALLSSSSHQQIYQSFGKTDFCASFHANCQYQ